MCDTFVAMPNYTKSGNLIFGKNSDREPNEAQAIVRVGAADHTEKEVRCTFISVPQVKSTYEVVLSKPFEMWGAEMGANEKGLVIGNEAVFTRIPKEKKNTGLTGMDMIRLALERGDSASAAFDLITGFIENYGQDACGGYMDRGFFYHNSWIIADAKEAWVLESADRHWAALKVKDFRSISNGLSIESDFDASSKGMIDYAVKNGWHKGGDFSFKKSFADRFFTYFSMGGKRRSCSMKLGAEARGTLDVGSAMSILRDHGQENFRPGRGDMSCLCLHATGVTTPSQTTGSLVAEIRPGGHSTFWLTGSAAPCLSIYKPFFPKDRTILQGSFQEPSEKPDGSLWWTQEKFHRSMLGVYAQMHPRYAVERDALEAEFREKEKTAHSQSQKDREAFSVDCLTRSQALTAKWTELVRKEKNRTFAPLYNMSWKRWNREAGIA